jgi:hypothetical protein
MLFLIELTHLRRPYGNYYISATLPSPVHGQTNHCNAKWCVICYVYTCKSYMQNNWPFSLPTDKTWQIIVLVTHKQSSHFFILQTLECSFISPHLGCYIVFIARKSEPTNDALKSVFEESHKKLKFPPLFKLSGNLPIILCIWKCIIICLKHCGK